jgi:hypothetical protein
MAHLVSIIGGNGNRVDSALTTKSEHSVRAKPFSIIAAAVLRCYLSSAARELRVDPNAKTDRQC